MHAPLKAKSSRKNKSKTSSIEHGIPEAPRISDFQKTECLESSNHRNEANSTAKKQLDLEESEHEEEEENQKSETLPGSEKQSDLKKEENNYENNELCGNLGSLDISKERIDESRHSSEVDNVNNAELTSELPRNIEDCSDIDSYFNLTLKVKNYITEINEPSAPAVEGNILATNCLVMNTPQKELSIAKTEIDISKYKFTLKIEDTIMPFSEEKLSEYYYNPELHDCKIYTDEFINQEINNGTKGDFEFYRLLVSYMQAKNHLKATESQISSLRKKLNICISAMWTVWDDVTVTEEEKCSDGNLVNFVEKYTQAQFNPQVLQEFNSLFSQLKYEIFEVYSTNSFTCSSLKMKIEYYLQCVLTSCPEFTNLEENSPPVLSSFSANSHFQQCLSDLKVAISILFIFQRKQSLEIDSSFLEETRQWLTDLISVLLRNSTWKDHIFLLNHVIRCPGGVSEWAAQFVQIPFSRIPSDPFKNVELNHMVSVMNILLSPIKQREKFIKKWESELANDVNPWTVIDSDGEVEDDDQQCCPLKENDLVSFLNQIPFRDLFAAVLKCGDKDVSSPVDSDYILKLFSFLTDFIKVLLSGLKQYTSQRYRQFTKRLGRLIYHTVQYATDSLVNFKSQNFSEDELKRIQAEYDNFFLRSTKVIYSAKKHGTWQFLATIPFHMPSSNTILKLYGILQLNDHEDDSIVHVNFSKFVDKFLQLPQEEQFYLLTTFANMVLARNITEIQFIKNVLLQLLFIGFLNPSTMEDSYKNVRSLLSSICSSYPFLMSDVLFIQQNTFISNPSVDQKLMLDCWAKLPMEIWQPEKKDLDILASWLLEPVDSVRSELARLILQSLNYGLNHGELFLPVEDHQAIAFMILQANAKLMARNESGVIKNVSNLVLYHTPDQSVIDWTWNVLLRLRLHLLDKSDATMCKYFYDLNVFLQNIPDVKSNADLHRLVLKKDPVACYIALMTTTLGHSVPIIFNKGFELVEVLLNNGKYEAGLACLEHLTMLFVDCSDSIYKCEKFIFLLSRLIAADNSYVQFAKNLISYNFPGPVLKCLESMIQNQLNRWRALNFSKFSHVIQLWLHSFTRLPLWTQEPGILYLLDKLVNNSFFDGVTMKIVTSILGDLLEAQSPSSETKSSLSSLVGWMNSKYNPPSLLPKGFNGEIPWFAYQIIQMEYEMHEKSSSIWVELLKELYSSNDKKVNVDNSLKKVCNSLKIPIRSSNVLAIYKWTYQILETEISHPLVPLLWQRFFFLYFYRVPGLTDRGSIGMKFFDGIINQGLFKRLKAKVEETCELYRSLSEKENDKQQYYLKCHGLFLTYSVWLLDPKLHEPCISVHMLPIQYNPELLGLLMHGSEVPWIEYLEYQNIEENFRNTGLTWIKLKNRLNNRRGNRIMSRKMEKPPSERILERLNTYEVPLPPPRVNLKKYTFPRVNVNILMNADKMISYIKPLLHVLLEYVEWYPNGINENNVLSCDMQELLPRLYITTETQKVLKGHCNGVYKTVNGKNTRFSCSGPAVVKLTYQESRVNDQARQHFDRCEKALDRNIQKSLAALPPKLISSAVLIDVALEELKKEYNLTNARGGEDSKKTELKRTGVYLFYELARIWCKRVTHTPALNRTFENCVEVLGKSFIENNPDENEKILHLILADDGFGEILCEYFTPNASSTCEFIENYSKALDCALDKSFFILSKFDLIRWLSEKKPKFSERSRFISTIGRGLKFVKSDGEGKSLVKLLNQHLETLLMYDFPEHYGEILNFLLEASEKQLVSPSTWFMFLNALAFGQFAFTEGRNDQNVFEPGQSVKKLKCYFSKFATDQNLISFEVVRGSVILLANTFKTERIKVGAHGLYRKYRLCLEPIFIFFGMLSYSCVTKVIEISTGSLSDKLAQQLWPLLSDLYSPWLVPYWTENHKGQELQLPWMLNDSCHASFCASIFTESVRFIFDTLPGLNPVLSYTWFFYVTNFANIYVKDYILNVIHDSLVSLSWKTFFPTLQDVEMMLKVVDQFLPLCHSFLGNIFVSIKWTDLVQYYIGAFDAETVKKLHICLLHLLVKLPLEPSLKQNENVIALLTEAKGYAWHLVDSTNYETVLNWFIMSCDPRIILMDERLEYYKLDSTILRLLQACAGFVPHAKYQHSTGLAKKLTFVRACVKWMITSNRRFKSKDSPFFKTALQNFWSDMETVIIETVPPHQRVEEAAILLSEFSLIFAEPELCSLVEATLSDWLLNRNSQVIVFGLLRSFGNNMENPSLYGSIIESSLESYFTFQENCDWSEIINVLTLYSKSKSEARLDNILRDNGHFLTLYATLIKRSHNQTDFSPKMVMADLLQLLSEVKSSIDLEPKLILLITFGLELAENQIKISGKEDILYLVKFSEIFTSIVSDKGNGFLSAIGLKKPSFSNKFKLICLVANSGIIMFLKNSYPESRGMVDEKLLLGLEQAEANKNFQNIQQYVSYAKSAVKDVSKVDEIINLMKHLGLKLFNKLYLK